ncbi:MAG: hypothetical protein IH595_14540 [Bacteroidales bacterium]|nr:hypothetical protein [Bacteroidales bacterium]
MKITIFIVMILLSVQMNGQEMLGLGFSNYSGISGKNINPAFLTGSKVYLDVNLVGAGISIENNFAYIPSGGATIWSIIRGDSLPEKYSSNYFDSFYTYYRNKPNYNMAATATIMGPGVMLQDGKQAFGISLSARNYESAYHFPVTFLQNIYNQEPNPGQTNKDYGFNNFSMASLSWSELSFNYAYDFYERYGNKFTAGIEFKVLYGIEGFYSQTSVLKYHWLSYDTIRLDTLNTTAGMSLPVNYNNNNTNLSPWDKGHGFGVNIGFLYTKNESNVSEKGEKALCAKPYEDYKYRIGFSIMDIGGIRFKNNARLYQLQTGNLTLEATQIKFYNTVDSTMNYLAQILKVDTSKMLKGSEISMSLPTALSLQMDYHYRKNIYISGFWIHPLRFNKQSLRRPAQLAVIPRYDTRMLGVSVPVSWYDYQQLRLGLALRIYSVTLGTEKLGTLLGLGNLSGMDFYFNIKINLEKGTCLSWKKGACSAY